MNERIPSRQTSETSGLTTARYFALTGEDTRGMREWLGAPDSSDPSPPEDLARIAKDTEVYLLSRPARPKDLPPADSHYEATLDDDNPRHKTARQLVDEWAEAELFGDRTRAADIFEVLAERAMRRASIIKRRRVADRREDAAHAMNALYDRKERAKNQLAVEGPPDDQLEDEEWEEQEDREEPEEPEEPYLPPEEPEEPPYPPEPKPWPTPTVVPAVESPGPFPALLPQDEDFLTPLPPQPPPQWAGQASTGFVPISETGAVMPSEVPTQGRLRHIIEDEDSIPNLEPEEQQPAGQPTEQKKRLRDKLRHAWYAGMAAVSARLTDPEKGYRRQAIIAFGAAALITVAAFLYARHSGGDLGVQPPDALPPSKPKPQFTKELFDNLQPQQYEGQCFEWGAAANDYGPPSATPKVLDMINAARAMGAEVNTWGDVNSGCWGINDITVYFADGNHESYYETERKWAILQYLAKLNSPDDEDDYTYN